MATWPEMDGGRPAEAPVLLLPVGLSVPLEDDGGDIVLPSRAGKLGGKGPEHAVSDPYVNRRRSAALQAISCAVRL